MITMSARERLLAAANELFYAEGIHSVGIDRVIEKAGVAKASLYSTFGSKEELIRAYLEGRAESRRARITAAIAGLPPGKPRILAVFDLAAEYVAQPSFRGCAFVRASAEGPAGVRAPCVDHRAWVRALFVTLAEEHGAADPELLAAQLTVIYDGAITGAAMDSDPARARVARGMAETLLARSFPAISGMAEAPRAG